MKPSSRNKNYSIALIVVVVLFVLIKFIVFPLVDKVSEQRTTIKFKEQSLEKYVKAVEQKKSLQLKLKKLKKESRKTNSGFLKGETPSLSAADLQKIIDGIAEENGVKIKSVKVLDSIQQAAIRNGRQCQMLFRGGPPADHPVLLSMPESGYLKFHLFRVL